MDKQNIFRSTNFHMAQGDVLHMLIIDETGVAVTIDLLPESDEEYAPDQPIATAATDITEDAFTANWDFIENTSGFYIDVASDIDFTTFVTNLDPSNPGVLNNFDVGYTNSLYIEGLDAAVIYYYRIRAYNDIGTSVNSNVITVTTDAATPAGALLDMDGNEYTTVVINNKEWIIENLRTTKYSDGTAIANLTDDGDWMADTSGAYCWYDNDIGYRDIYGALYNWYAGDLDPSADNKNIVYLERDGVQESGWRVASETDWDDMITYLGGDYEAALKLSEAGTTHFLTDGGATNESGFTNLPGGARNGTDGSFQDVGIEGDYWTSDENSITEGWARFILNNSVDRDANNTIKEFGYSIRLVRDLSSSSITVDSTVVRVDSTIITVDRT